MMLCPGRVLGPRALTRGLGSAAAGSDSGRHCREVVRARDHEHYLASLLLPAGTTVQAALALRALSCEVAGVRDSVTDRALGRVRAQFWKDAVAKMYEPEGVVPHHPVVLEVAGVVSRHRPSQQLLEGLAGSRDHFLSDLPFSSLERAEQYGVEAFASIYLLLLEVTGSRSGHAKHAVTQVGTNRISLLNVQLGKCEGLVTLLRGTPHHASKRRLYLPSDLLLEQGVSQEGVLRRGPMEEGIRDVVELVAERAQRHLEAARLRTKHLSREHKLLLLPCVACDHYLASLAKADCNLWDKSLHTR